MMTSSENDLFIGTLEIKFKKCSFCLAYTKCVVTLWHDRICIGNINDRGFSFERNTKIDYQPQGR